MDEIWAVRDFPERGRGVATTRRLPAGTLMVDELPLLLTIAQDHVMANCSHCLRRLPVAGHRLCHATHQACFCSEQCESDAEVAPGGISLAVRRTLRQVPWCSLTDEEAQQLRFATQVLSLQALAAVQVRADHIMKQLTELCVGPQLDAGSLQRVQAALAHAIPNAPDLGPLLAREACNSFGILTVTPEGNHNICGSALYANASLFNHECLPNAARTDDFDIAGDKHTHMRIRLLHDMPENAEVTISYTPLNWSRVDRQQQCQSVYGFVCKCPRCQVEETLLPDGQLMPAACDRGDLLDPTYLQLFLLKYLCPANECFGTMVPVQCGATDLTCNKCGQVLTEEQFHRDLESSSAQVA